jgi:hypothetical protein
MIVDNYRMSSNGKTPCFGRGYNCSIQFILEFIKDSTYPIFKIKNPIYKLQLKTTKNFIILFTNNSKKKNYF